MKTAKLIKKLKTFSGDAGLYRLSEPMEYEDKTTNFVVVSATVAMFSGPETYIFPASRAGAVVDWGELDGSTKGTLSHASALRNAGFGIVSSRPSPRRKKP